MGKTEIVSFQNIVLFRFLFVKYRLFWKSMVIAEHTKVFGTSQFLIASALSFTVCHPYRLAAVFAVAVALSNCNCAKALHRKGSLLLPRCIDQLHGLRGLEGYESYQRGHPTRVASQRIWRPLAGPAHEVCLEHGGVDQTPLLPMPFKRIWLQ